VVAEWYESALCHPWLNAFKIGFCRLFALNQLHFIHPAHDMQRAAIFVQQSAGMRAAVDFIWEQAVYAAFQKIRA